MKKILFVILLFVHIGVFFVFSGPFDAAGSTNTGPSELRLTKKVHRLLSAEMNAIQNGMTNMAIAVPAGRWSEVAETVRKIREGYIMNKELTEDEMKDFTVSLPAGYIELDKEFMKTAEKLMAAAQEQDRERILSSLYQFYKSCVQCHAKYAQKRFPGFKE